VCALDKPECSASESPDSRSEQLERLNRARDFFGDPKQRWNDRLVVEACVFSKEYLSGRAALALHCNFPVESVSDLIAKRSGISEAPSTEHTAILILKANIEDLHKLQHWDEKMVLVPDVHVVKCPEQEIPSLVGLYVVQDEISFREDDLLLFQSTIKATFELIPRISYWEPSPIARTADELVPHEVESAPEIVEGVADNYGAIISRKAFFSKFDMQKILSGLRVVIDIHSVNVALSELAQKRCNVKDMLVGPLNLFV
jgi:hypothetical protein